LKPAYWWLGLVAIGLLAAALRLHGIHNPMLDHPGWRQGDTAAIARNFARLQFSIMRPQTNYNGAPPNYVELELQIVPFVAALLYKLFGVHEIFGRLVSLTFSLATVVTVAYFGRWLFASAAAGMLGAFFYAIFPGSVYYGRTFMPDSAMIFFLTAALYAAGRYLLDNQRRSPWTLASTTALLSLAYLAKPVAVLAIAPLSGLLWQRTRDARRLQPLPVAILLVLPLLLLWLYDRTVASYAEWHWASGIARLHVLPALQAAFTSRSAFAGKLLASGGAFDLLRVTMLGSVSFFLSIASFVGLPWVPSRSRAMLWGWLVGGLIYLYVVVTVERVDYYLYPFLPLCALTIGGALARLIDVIRGSDTAPTARYAVLAAVALVPLTALAQSRSAVASYYHFNARAYRNAVELDRSLSRNALVVIGHYGPDLQYYIDRFGWEEDPALWTPFDEESAIRKGARYFISIEDERLRRNLDLCAWLQRYPVRKQPGGWPVYETDPTRAAHDAERFWRAFRNAERAGAGRAFLDARGRCTVTGRSR
jgi:hypothetical protein